MAAGIGGQYTAGTPPPAPIGEIAVPGTAPPAPIDEVAALTNPGEIADGHAFAGTDDGPPPAGSTSADISDSHLGIDIPEQTTSPAPDPMAPTSCPQELPQEGPPAPATEPEAAALLLGEWPLPGSSSANLGGLAPQIQSALDSNLQLAESFLDELKRQAGIASRAAERARIMLQDIIDSGLEAAVRNRGKGTSQGNSGKSKGGSKCKGTGKSGDRTEIGDVDNVF